MKRSWTGPSLIILGVCAAFLPPVSADDSEVDVNAVKARSATEAACLDRAHERLSRTLRLFEESRVQLRAPRASKEVREDAARALEALEARLRAAIQELGECLPEGPTASSTASRPVVVVPPPPDPVAERVAQMNPATEQVDRQRPLAGEVSVLVGEKVDGHGCADALSVREAVSQIGPQLGACYERLVQHRGRQSGTGILVFTVAHSGRVTDVDLEQLTLGSAGFERCLERAARRLRVSGGSKGGDATYSYTLRFGR